jgi:two-component system cell cycle sensor histidine kinase/response regulator CckA
LSDKATGHPHSPPSEGEPASDVAALRQRVAELEAELARHERLAGAEGTLAAREIMLSEVEKVAHLGSWTLDLHTNQVTWSEELYRILGYDPAVDVPSTERWFGALHPDDLKQSIDTMQLLMETGKLVPTILRVVWKDGTTREIYTYGAVLNDAQGQPRRAVGAVLDVTDSRRAQREAERMARFLQEAQRVAKVGSWVWDSRESTVDWSSELAGIFGMPADTAPTTQVFRERLHPDDRHKLPQYRDLLASGGKVEPVEVRVVRPDGSLRYVLISGKRLDSAPGAERFLGTVWDITERKQLEEQLRQSQKMEVVGRVAGGVAHDFNNLLTVVAGNADLLLEELGDDERARSIRDAAEVGAALTRQLLAFSRQAVVKPGPLDLNEAVREFTRIADRLIGEDVSIELQLAHSSAVILADRGQIQQILLNLAVNARDAMARGGKLVFSTRLVRDDAQEAGTPPRWIELEVKDTGTGMDEVTRGRALEPFFTTKDPGKGTGLGLSTIADIVQQMRGSIAIASAPDRGTTVTIRLPRSRLEMVRSVPAPAPVAAHSGRECILLVEDNGELRELLSRFLLSAGYRVLSVGSPREAEEVWKTQRDAIDLLIADMVMPDKSGQDLARALLAERPSLRVLFISGYTPDRSGLGDRPFLQKPFTRAELLDTVRALFEAKPAVAGS